MMSSMSRAYLVLSSATLHSVSGTTWCQCITRLVAVPDRWTTVLAPGCSLLCWLGPTTCLPTRLIGI
jgi:hypothetical protein